MICAQATRHAIRYQRFAFQADCSTLIEGRSDYRKNDEVMEDLAAALKGDPYGGIDGGTQTADKNTFRLGPEPEEHVSPGDND